MVSLIKNIFVFILVIVFCLGGVELMLRFWYPIPPQTPFYILEQNRGWALRPGARGIQKKEGRAEVRINSRGLRGPEYSLEKPERGFRVAVIGDSFTEALQVADEKSFSAVIERELNKGCEQLAGRNVEVLNFGVQGYGTAQELITLREYVWQYGPDAVVLAFFPGNDVYDNHPELNPNNPDLAPYFVPVEGQEQLALINSYAQSSVVEKGIFHLRKWLLIAQHYSHFARFLGQRLPGMSFSGGAEKRSYWESKYGADYLEWFVWKTPLASEMNEAWEITQGLLGMMVEEVRSRNVPFVVAVLSAAIQVHPNDELRREFARRFRLASLYYPEERLEHTLRASDAVFLPLAKPLLDYAHKSAVMLHGFENMSPGFGHLNESGHQKTGELIAKAVCDCVK